MPPTKQDIISRVTCAAMHVLHDSRLYDSDLWPEHGFKAGYPKETFIHDEVYIAAKICNYPLHKEDDQSVIFNMHSFIPKRIKEQALEIDLIMDNAVYDGILFNIWLHEKLGYSYRYYLTGIGSLDNHGLQLIFKFTLTD